MSQTEKIAEHQPSGFDAQSRLDGPIAKLSMLEQSLLFAELSTISYMDPGDAGMLANRIGFTSSTFFDRHGSQAYWFANDDDSVVCCRGTEPDDWNDIRADFYAITAIAETVGRVHRGFKEEVDDLWPKLEKALAENTKSLWFAGHSLGGAMATICAGRCRLSTIRSNPEAVFSFGSPRVGNKRYVNHMKLTHYRWVNNNDMVPRLPPAWLGFRHSGEEMYLNRNGDLQRIDGWRRFADRLRGFLRGLIRFRVDHLSDHSMFTYIDAIERAIKKQSVE